MKLTANDADKILKKTKEWYKELNEWDYKKDIDYLKELEKITTFPKEPLLQSLSDALTKWLRKDLTWKKPPVLFSSSIDEEEDFEEFFWWLCPTLKLSTSVKIKPYIYKDTYHRKDFSKTFMIMGFINVSKIKPSMIEICSSPQCYWWITVPQKEKSHINCSDDPIYSFFSPICLKGHIGWRYRDVPIRGIWAQVKSIFQKKYPDFR